jgi:dTDP-4-dehydrorhamnose 3,5-epimerase
MQVTPTSLPEVLLIEPRVFGDERGFFYESWNRRAFAAAGIAAEFVQDNHSRSRRGVLRGLHYQVEHAQGKLVRAVAGEVFDVAVDLRRGSPTYGRWAGFTLDDASMREVFVPAGFAHGFCVLSEVADVVYKCSSYYDPATEAEIAYDDPDIAIAWPTEIEPIVSERDANAPRFADVAAALPF